ncbi:oxidoreductase [Paenibacillus albidus]|uniref:Oxidoreductase n=1 Tax=Paenibacillus albidus TaxID=2041023 RepID=A0A917CLY1_9BACL|nr:SDR family oxidoreductase [Paenibacillus albidus]GGF91631.1 oxidoreductase [Paenibacillus albidus]
MNILITGGSRGIGLAISRKLGAGGHRLLISGRDKHHLESAAALLPKDTLYLTADAGELSSINQLAEYAKEHTFSPDVLVLNAAAFYDASRSVIEPDVTELERILRVNLLANVALVKAFLPAIKAGSYPRIFFIGSTAALRSDSSFYAISKAALSNYAHGLREELKTFGVGVTLIHPGATFTERRVPGEGIAEDRFLASNDIAKIVETMLDLSPQAVVEEISIRPMLGDTY